MDKKQYVLKLLTWLEKDRAIAAGLKTMIEKGFFSDATIDGLQQVFQAAIKTMNTGKQAEKLRKSVSFLKKLKEAESQQNLKDQEDLNGLDAMLQDI